MLTFLFVVALGGAAYVVVTRYNALQRMAQGIHEARANVLAAMKKRHDLVDQLKEVVQSYADRESATHLTLGHLPAESALLATGESVGSVVSHVAQLASRYPDLKSNQQYNLLMQELSALEGNLEGGRTAYNAQVRAYNTALTQIPTSLFAGSLGFRPAEYFNPENADSLENLRSFTDDGTLVREMFATGGRRMAAESARLGRAIVEKGREIQAARGAGRADGTGGGMAGDAGFFGPRDPSPGPQPPVA